MAYILVNYLQKISQNMNIKKFLKELINNIINIFIRKIIYEKRRTAMNLNEEQRKKLKNKALLMALCDYFCNVNDEGWPDNPLDF